MRTSLRAKPSAGAKQNTRAPFCLIRLIAAPLGRPPASTTWPTRWAAQMSMSSISRGCKVIRLTPKGRSVSDLVAAISADNSSGVIEPEAMTPKPPALDMAATRLRSDTQVIAPPIMARLQPSTAVPRAHKRSSSARKRSHPETPRVAARSPPAGTTAAAISSIILRRRARRPCAAPARQARCIRQQSGR